MGEGAPPVRLHYQEAHEGYAFPDFTPRRPAPMKTYTLTLSLAERRAIDWIGDRYAHGNELYSLLWARCEQTPDDADWDDPRPIDFTFTPKRAHDLTTIRDDDQGHWTCFAPEFAKKFDELCNDYERDFPNLDATWPDDLEAYAADKTNPKELREYALNKAFAIRARERGENPRAFDFECACQRIYSGLPYYMKW